MSENIIKYLAIFFIIIVVWSFCTDDYQQESADNYDVTVQTMIPASDGLDLKAVGEVLKKANTAQEFEELLNSPAQGINNLDLNQDGNVDYISVTEYGNEQLKGFSLTTQPAEGETQELATIEVEKASDSEAKVQIKGNEQIYGRNHYHHSSFGLTDFLILSYLFRPHSFYSSPWGYGSYPGSYRPYSTSPYNDYSRRTRGYTSGSRFQSSNAPITKSNVQSPNAGKAAKSVRAPLKNPTSSQKSFQSSNRSSSRSGGFGRSSSSSSSRSSSLRRSSSSRSGGFRSGK